MYMPCWYSLRNLQWQSWGLCVLFSTGSVNEPWQHIYNYDSNTSATVPYQRLSISRQWSSKERMCASSIDFDMEQSGIRRSQREKVWTAWAITKSVASCCQEIWGCRWVDSGKATVRTFVAIRYDTRFCQKVILHRRLRYSSISQSRIFLNLSLIYLQTTYLIASASSNSWSISKVNYQHEDTWTPLYRISTCWPWLEHRACSIMKIICYFVTFTCFFGTL